MFTFLRNMLAVPPAPERQIQFKPRPHFHFEGCFQLVKKEGTIYLVTISRDGTHLEQRCSRATLDSFLRNRQCCKGSELMDEVRC
jgi:hypothetical protein